jgi:hypothetical protein
VKVGGGLSSPAVVEEEFPLKYTSKVSPILMPIFVPFLLTPNKAAVKDNTERL